MEANKSINEKATVNAAPKDAEIKATPRAPAYNPDDYMEDHFLYTDICFSCKHWNGYTCALNFECKHEVA